MLNPSNRLTRPGLLFLLLLLPDWMLVTAMLSTASVADLPRSAMAKQHCMTCVAIA